MITLSPVTCFHNPLIFFETPTDRTDVIINTRTNEKWALIFRFSDFFDDDGKVRRLKTSGGDFTQESHIKKPAGVNTHFALD